MADNYYYDSPGLIGGLLGGIFGTIAVLFYVALVVIAIASLWRVFQKAGLQGWEAIIPIYNLYCLYKITWGNGWLFLLLLIPFINAVIGIVTLYKLAQVFGKGLGFFFGLLFLNIIFMPWLAFGDSRYIGVHKNDNIINM